MSTHHQPARTPNEAPDAGSSQARRVGDLLDLEVGAPAHGGHCVARYEGRVVFVRHALPGERVRARITQQNSKLWRADAVEILEASADRVPTVWEAAGPGGVGGAELGHVALPAQRRWKANVLRDTLRRIGGPEVLAAAEAAVARAVDEHGDEADVLRTIRPLPSEAAADADGLHTRTRVTFTVDDDRRVGMHAHRSHEVLAVSEMPLAAADVAGLGLFGDPRWRRHWRPGSSVEVIAPSVGEPVVLVDGRAHGPNGPRNRANVREEVSLAGADRPDGVAELLEYRVAADGFWQVHREAPRALVLAVLDAATRLGVGAGARVLELYSGAGLLTLPLAQLVGGDGTVVAIEQAERAVKDARRTLHDAPWVHLVQGGVTPGSVAAGARTLGDTDLVVLDPPRAGAGAEVIEAVAGTKAGGVALVSCDPAALARDLAAALRAGYQLEHLTALDLFPHTHHFEAVATLRRS